MRPAVALLLAAPRGHADRRRFVLVAVAVALAAALLLAALRVARVRGNAYGDPDLANFVIESGLRPGLVVGTLLLCLPVVGLLLQALRVGAMARGRRTAGLRLAGGTPAAVRSVAAAEGAIAGAAGGLLAGPLYLALGAALRAAPQRDIHVVPAPTALDVVVWLVVVALATAGAAAAASFVERRTVADPLAVGRHRRASAPGRVSLAVVVLGIVLVGAAFALPSSAALASAGVGGLLVAFAGGGWSVRGISVLLLRAEGARCLVVGSRLAADLRAPGRVAAVLVLCGVAIGLDLAIAGDFYAQENTMTDDGFYAAGFALAAVATAVAGSIAMATLVVGAVEGLIDGRRPLAGLAALGAGEAFLARALRLELAAISAPPVFVGIALAGLFPAILAPGSFLGAGVVYVLIVLGVALLGALWMVAASALLTLLLRGRIRSTVDPSNLRAA